MRRVAEYGWPIALLAVLVGWVDLEHPYRSGPQIRSDGVGYHAWTKAILTGDLTFCAWQGSDAGFISFVDPVRHVCQNKYPPGLALIQLPFMVFAIDRSTSPTKITAAEQQVSMLLGTTVLLTVLALLSYCGALLRVPPLRTGVAILLTTFGTGLFHYGTYDSSFTHVYSALFCALAIALAVRERVTGHRFPLLIASACGFFLFELRNTNLFVLIGLASAYLAYSSDGPWQPRLCTVGAAIGGTTLGIIVQLSYNYYVQHAFVASSYGQERFLFDRPMQDAVLLSYERGLFTYYPLFGLALLTGAFVRSARPLDLLLLVLIGLLVGLYGYWHSWALGGGMGHRGFVEVTPVLAVVLMLSWRSMSRYAWGGSALVGLCCALVTLQIMIGYWNGTYPFGGATPAEYWSHVRSIEGRFLGFHTCHTRRCEDAFGSCRPTDAPDGTFCLLDLTHQGSCVAGGTCAPTVALRALAAKSQRLYVTAPMNGKRPEPLVARARTIGAWERFIIVPRPDDAKEVYLQSLSNYRYVTLSIEPSGRSVLTARAKTPGENEIFQRIGPDSSVSFRAKNNRYVVALPSRGAPALTLATSVTPDDSGRFEIVPAP